MSRGDLSEAEWRILKGLLPIEPENRGRGRRRQQNRSIMNGILWRLRCGAPWRDVPPKYGSWNTIYRRFRRWSEAGVWGGRGRNAGRGHGRQRPLQHRQHHSPRPCLGSGRKRGTYQRALGRSRGGGRVSHCLADALGRLLAFILTGGERQIAKRMTPCSFRPTALQMPSSLTKAMTPMQSARTLPNARSRLSSPADQTAA